MPKKKDVMLHEREIGRRIKTRRNELGMSQSALAAALGLTFQQIQKYEKGSNRISAGRLQRVAEILEVPVTFFFNDFRAADGTQITTLLDSAYSLRMLKAMARIKDQSIKRRAVELVEALAKAADGQPSGDNRTMPN